MGRLKLPLQATYGTLTVIGELPKYMVRVRCTCGTEKDVQRSNLRSGRITSCGAPLCRAPYVRSDQPTPKAGKKPRLPTWITLEQVKKLWEDYTVHKVEAMIIAKAYAVHTQSVYNLMRQIRRAGGIDEFVEQVLAMDEVIATAPKAIKTLVTPPSRPVRMTLPETGVPKPPAVYVPKH